MDSRLTDADLIQLVQEKLPEELSLAEIHLLHERLKESSELKAVLIGQLHLETYLSSALAEINVSVDEIVRRAGAIEQPKPGMGWPLWTGLAGVILAAGVGIYFATKPDGEPRNFAENSEKLKLPDERQPNKKTTDQNQPEQKPAINTTQLDPPITPMDANTQDKIAETAPPETPNGKPADPWFASLDPEAAPLLLADTAFRIPRWQRGEPLRKAEAQAWIKPAFGQGFRIDDKEANNERWVELNGVGKLQAPWVPNAVLRMSLFDDENFRLHFWCGDQGVTLWHYRNRRPQLWAAYASQRKSNKPLPEQLTNLLTSDDGRQSRVRSGVVEFRYQDGSLVMSQGLVRLLSVPLPSCPKEVIFDGKVMLSELAMYRGECFPPDAPNPRPLVGASAVPADAAWTTSLPGRDLREGLRELGQARKDQADWQESLGAGIVVSAQEGHVRLAVEKSDKPVYVGTPLKRAGFYEIIFRVDEAAPGTGIYFGDDQGKELHRVSFLKDRRTGQLALEGWRNYNEKEFDRDPKNEPVAYFQPNQWIRVVWGFNSFKMWTSGDGEHWGLALYPTRGLSGPFSTLGLMVQHTEEPRQISLAHLEIRELSALTSLASETARKLAPPMGNLSNMDFGAWNQTVLASWPEVADANLSIPMDEWRRACVIRSLAESPWCTLSSTLLRELIEDGLQSTKSLPERFRLLDEVSLLFDLWGGGEAAAMVSMYERLGTIAAEEGHADPFGLVITRLQTSPIWTEANMQIIQPDFTREMLLREAYTQDWQGLRSIARRTEFLMLSSHPQQNWWWERDQRSLLAWAEMLANQEAPDLGGENADWVRLASRGRQWMHPLVTQVSKEGYNVMAEFEAALAGDGYADACRIITSAGRAGLAGLLPDSKDPHLLVSLPRAIAIAMREHPELQATMREQFGEIGKVRAREAMTRADVESVEAATVRFFGTPAAAEAYQWLGDRALASGKFAQAAQAYQEGLPFAENSLEEDLRSRLRLAAGMLGHNMESEQSSTVQIATASWTGAEFDQLIAELKQSHARADSRDLADWDSSLMAQSPPPPAFYRAVVRTKFTGDLGKGVGKYEDRNTDWAARQLAVATDDDVMYLSNRFQIACYRQADGQAVWAKGLGEEQGDVNSWPFIPMQPLPIGDRVFVRRLTKRGPELACLDKKNGEVHWHVRPEHHVASDPVFVQGRLLAFMATIPQSGMLQLELTSFHPETGAVLSQQPVLTLRDEWNGCPPCQILATNGKILCTIGGATMCCDSLGQPQWLQQHPWLPGEVDRYSKWQQHQPPLVAEGRVYATQSGVREVACFELATGRKIWSQPLPHLIRLAGIAGGNLVVQTEMGLLGFDQLTGEPRWRHVASEMLHGLECGGDRLVYSRLLEASPEDNVCLVWLDPRTGEEIAHSLFEPLEDEALRFGPLVTHGDRFWGFFGRGFKDAERDLVELVPDPAVPAAGPLHPDHLAYWVDEVLPRSFANTAVVLPGWLLATRQHFSGNEQGVPWLPEFRGEKSLIKTRLENNRPVHFVREVKLADNGPASLKLRVGHDGGKSWTLKVQLGSQTLQEQIVDDATAPNGWLEREIDLKPWAGKTVWISVSHTLTEGKEPGDAYWKTLEITGQTSPQK